MKKLNITKLLIVNCQLLLVLTLLSSPAHAQLGTIGTGNFPVPAVGPAGTTTFVASLIRNSIRLLILVSFIAAFIYTILAGFKFITAGGDPKEVAAAQSQISWGIIGLVVVIGAYALIRVVEIFFNVDLITGGLTIPTVTLISKALTTPNLLSG